MWLNLSLHRFPAFNVPLSFDINYSPVTSIGYYGNCPDDFVAELQSVITKLPQQLNKSAKVRVVSMDTGGCGYGCVPYRGGP